MPAAPSIANSVTVRLVLPARPTAISEMTSLIERAGGVVTGLDVTGSGQTRLRVDVTLLTRDPDHAEEIVETIRTLDGVEIGKVSDRTFLLHLGGKLTVESKVPIRTRDDLSLIYTPGVARVCTAIARNPEDARRLTIKRNTVAVVTDGTAVLGLGDIGPLAALPVMEGKAALFKRFAGIDAFPLCLDTTDTEEIIRVVKAIAPGFAGINLEDISAPRCFEVESRLREELDIPVFHDDQHGTAIVALAALRNALKVVGKRLEDVRLVMSGAGAAGTAILKLLLHAGARHVVVCDVDGIISRDRHDVSCGDFPNQTWIAEHTNPENVTGTLADAVRGADVFLGVSAPNILREEDVAAMAPGSVVFAMANPTPEIDPEVAARHAAVVATGRSDFANQINNVLVFPGVFRGLIDAASKHVTTEVLLAAADALAGVVSDEERNATYIIPSVFHPDVSTVVADAVRRTVLAAQGGTPLPDVTDRPTADAATV